AGIVRFSMDTRQLVRLLFQGLNINPPPLPNNQPPPDPDVLADYNPGTLRLTRGDFPASRPAIVMAQYEDASWYRQRLAIEANPARPLRTYVPGHADRLFVFWGRATGATTAGPALFYKVLRPGVRVGDGIISSVSTANFQVTDLTAGGQVIPEEVDPRNGLI